MTTPLAPSLIPLDKAVRLRKILSLALTGTLICLCLGCAGLGSGYEPPTVTVSSFRALPGESVAPRFEIGLHIINPNPTDLNLRGVAYTIDVQGHKILTGVANDLPVIKAYGEQQIMLTGAVNLFNSIAFLTDMARSKGLDGLSYRLSAKLDPGGIHPVIRVSQKGTLSFAPPN